MHTMQFADEWLVPTVEPLVKESDIATLRDLKVDEPLSLWETLVQRKVLSDEQILSAVARRCTSVITPRLHTSILQCATDG